MKAFVLKSFMSEGVEFPKSSKIILDKSYPKRKRLHTLVYQQGRMYGRVGDVCHYLNNEKLQELSDSGFIKIEK